MRVVRRREFDVYDLWSVSDPKVVFLLRRRALSQVGRCIRIRTLLLTMLFIPFMGSALLVALARALCYSLGVGGTVLCGVCTALIGWRVLQVWERRVIRRFLPEILASHGRCTSCGYPLADSEGRRCPECGASDASRAHVGGA